MPIWKHKVLNTTIAAILLGASSQVFADATDSSIRINVTGPNGQPMANSQVEIIHTPTAKSRIYNTSESGRVIARGMKVGGPYVIRFPEDSKYTSTQPINNLFTSVGQTASATLTITDKKPIKDIEVIQIVSRGSLNSGETSEGPGSYFSRDKLDASPSISRDIGALLQQDSRANFDTNTGNLSIAGANNRFNSLTVDGVRQNDDFGLNLNGSPTNSSPIALDSIESIALNIAPFGVTYGSFQGGNVNVVTKSGTNEFHGTAFYTYSDDSLVGDKSKGKKLESDTFEDTTFSFSLGGPIIENKLFFFINYEESETTQLFPLLLDNQNNNNDPNEIQNVTQAQMDRVIQLARDEYAYDAGTFNSDHSTSDEKLLVKLDWEINDDHRMSLTYQDTDGTKVVDDFSFYRNPTFASPSSHRFNSRQSLEAVSVNVYSYWTENLSTEFKVFNKKVVTDNSSIGSKVNDNGLFIGEAHIATDTGGTIHVGPDHFRHANVLNNDMMGVKFVATYELNDDHTITAGYERDTLEIYNQFVPWSQGEYFYSSIDAYEAHDANSVAYGNALSENPADRTAAFETTTDTLYIQDEWYATDELTLTFGLRYETVTNDNGPVYNENFFARTGLRNDYVFDGEDIILPRLGFTYDLNDETVIRGGIGKFGGGTPNVWISNSYAQDGIRGNFRKQARGLSVDQLDGIPQTLRDAVTSEDVNADVDAVKPGTPLPSVWKYNIGITHELDLSMIGLGDDWHLMADVLVTEVEDAFIWTDLRQGDTGVDAPDGRPIRESKGFGFQRDVLLTTTDQGHGEVYTAQLTKLFETNVGDFNFSLGYSHQHINEANPGARFTAFDTYGSPAHVDAEDQSDGVTYAANTETQERWTSSLFWSHSLFGDNLTSIGLTYASRSGKNYSHTYSNGNAGFGGLGLIGSFNPKLLYIPTGTNDPLVTYAAGMDGQAFDDYIDSKSCLSEARGTVVGRNTCQNDWVHRWDIRISQEIKVFGDHSLLLFFDIENIGNLINDDWGRYEEYGFNTSTVASSIVNGGSQYEYSGFNGAPSPAVYKIPSVWKAQLGLRYTF